MGVRLNEVADYPLPLSSLALLVSLIAESLHGLIEILFVLNAAVDGPQFGNLFKVMMDVLVLVQHFCKPLAVSINKVAPVINTTKLVVRVLFLILGTNQIFLVLMILDVTNHLLVAIRKRLLVGAG